MVPQENNSPLPNSHVSEQLVGEEEDGTVGYRASLEDVLGIAGEPCGWHDREWWDFGRRSIIVFDHAEYAKHQMFCKFAG
jgi:hypothetical protein